MAITNCNKARKIHAFLRSAFPEKVMKFYCSDTGDKKDFSNVTETFDGVNLLMYTPTLTAGVSFEKHHYDSMYGIFDRNTADVEQCMQMMGRIRNLKDKHFNIHIIGGDV